MEEINIKETLQFFVSKWYYVLLFVVLFAVMGYVYFAHIQTPKYHSSTTIILVSEKEDTNTSTLSLNQQLVSTYSEIVRNRSVLSKVIKNLDLDMTVQELSRIIKVTSINDTQIIKIEVSSEDNELARDIAAEIANTFTKEVNNIFNLQNVTILSKAQIEKKPYNVSLVKQTALSAIAGLFTSLIIIFLIYYFDTSIKSAEAIENKTGLTVLGEIEKVRDKNEEK